MLRPKGFLRDREPLEVGPFRITPYLVDHSAYDAYALLVEADGRRLFYSGDLRAHGRKPGTFRRLLEDPPRDVDVLLLEGTRVTDTGDDGRSTLSEADLELALAERFRATEGLGIVLAAGQNLDRLVTAYRAARRAGRTLVVDLYTATLARATGRATMPQPGTHDVRVYIPNRQRVLVKRSGEFERTRAVAPHRVYLDELRASSSGFALLAQTSTLAELGRAGCLDGRERGLVDVGGLPGRGERPTRARATRGARRAPRKCCMPPATPLRPTCGDSQRRSRRPRRSDPHGGAGGVPGAAPARSHRHRRSTVAVLTKAQLRKRFAADEAPAIVRSISPTARTLALSGLSSRFAYFAADERLIVVAGPQEGVAAEMALAYGLSYLTRTSKTRLALTVPAGRAAPTLHRLPWLRVPVQVFEHTADGAECVEIPTREDVLNGVDDEFGRPPHDLGEREEWVRDLTNWANANSDLTTAHVKTYLAWHCRGNRVLRCQRKGAVVRVTAGVDSTHSPAVFVDVVGPLDGEQTISTLRAVVERAIQARLSEGQRGNPEHQLQANLRKNHKALGLVAAGLTREFAALRSARRPGFIDLLGRDEDWVVHLVETKIGDDKKCSSFRDSTTGSGTGPPP